MLTIVGIPLKINNNDALKELWIRLMESKPTARDVYDLYLKGPPPGKDFDAEVKRLNAPIEGVQKELLEKYPKIMEACKKAIQSLQEVRAKPVEVIINYNQLFANGTRGSMKWGGSSFSIVD